MTVDANIATFVLLVHLHLQFHFCTVEFRGIRFEGYTYNPRFKTHSAQILTVNPETLKTNATKLYGTFVCAPFLNRILTVAGIYTIRH